MSRQINNIHDKFFKSLMAEHHAAVDFMKKFLPEEVLKAINLDSLELMQDSFIDERLRESFSDALFRVRLAETPKELFISLLVEHKSFKYENTPFQLLQ